MTCFFERVATRARYELDQFLNNLDYDGAKNLSNTPYGFFRTAFGSFRSTYVEYGALRTDNSTTLPTQTMLSLR
jgi:hypothetical protein